MCNRLQFLFYDLMIDQGKMITVYYANTNIQGGTLVLFYNYVTLLFFRAIKLVLRKKLLM